MIVGPAVEEANAFSNIVVRSETRRRSRPVTDIRFLIEKNVRLVILALDGVASD